METQECKKESDLNELESYTDETMRLVNAVDNGLEKLISVIEGKDYMEGVEECIPIKPTTNRLQILTEHNKTTTQLLNRTLGNIHRLSEIFSK